MTEVERKNILLIIDNLKNLTNSRNDLETILFIPLGKSIKQEDKDIYSDLFDTYNRFLEKHAQAQSYIKSLAKGDLNAVPPSKNLLASPFKNLHANLNHLVWQTKQVATGDLNQRMDFMGEFSKSFNILISALKEKQKIEEELRVNQQDLQASNVTKDRFLSIIAHDLRNPIGAVKNALDFLRDHPEMLSDSDTPDFIVELAETSKTAYDLLENLLTWSRSQRGIIQFNPEENDLYYLIKEVIPLVQINADNKKIAITSNVEENTLIEADYNMVATIIRNLVTNAIKFTKESGEVKINAYPDEVTKDKKDKYLVISIEDNGVGISQENIGKLFKIDQNYTSEGTNREKGSGLGLILCTEFVDKHSGKIWVESQLNVGSKFKFTVPLSKTE